VLPNDWAKDPNFPRRIATSAAKEPVLGQLKNSRTGINSLLSWSELFFAGKPIAMFNVVLCGWGSGWRVLCGLEKVVNSDMWTLCVFWFWWSFRARLRYLHKSLLRKFVLFCFGSGAKGGWDCSLFHIQMHIIYCESLSMSLNDIWRFTRLEIRITPTPWHGFQMSK